MERLKAKLLLFAIMLFHGPFLLTHPVFAQKMDYTEGRFWAEGSRECDYSELAADARAVGEALVLCVEVFGRTVGTVITAFDLTCSTFPTSSSPWVDPTQPPSPTPQPGPIGWVDPKTGFLWNLYIGDNGEKTCCVCNRQEGDTEIEEREILQ